jgi:sialate O-acetylesterase
VTTFRGPTIQGRTARVTFNHASGLRGSLEGFQLAGADGVYFTADAVLEGDTIVLTSTEVPSPKTVRYGWSDTVHAGLFNGAGLPAVPFRTDKLPWMTQGSRW